MFYNMLFKKARTLKNFLNFFDCINSTQKYFLKIQIATKNLLNRISFYNYYFVLQYFTRIKSFPQNFSQSNYHSIKNEMLLIE